MKVVIDMPEEMFEAINFKRENRRLNPSEFLILNGIPLPEGHGRLIDADEVIKIANKTKDLHGAIWNASTIIEADKEGAE